MLALVVLTLSSCVINASDKVSSQTVTNISAAKVKEIMSDNDPFILLDVRSEEEFKEMRIESAILIPDNEIKERAPVELPDKDVRIVVYCWRGYRSAFAVNELVKMGYTHVYNLGGIIDWPYEAVSGY
jgi:rhodanese-related sulfurtransferase